MAIINEAIFEPNQKPRIPNKLLFKNRSLPNTLHHTLKGPLVLLQVFAFFPLQGILGSSYKDLKFTWLSWKVFYCLIFYVGYIFHYVCVCINRKIQNMLDINAIVFHLGAILLSTLFFYLAMQWPTFVKEWHLVEMTMKSYKLAMNLRKKITMIIVAILGLALVEHTMAISRLILLSIEKHPTSAYDAAYDFYANRQFKEIFCYLPFYVWIGVYFQIIIIQQTFIWTFTDIFIILISVCFHFRLKQVSDKLSHMSRTAVSDEYVWYNTRKDFLKISRLLEVINHRMCWLIILSFFTNLYHILSQLFSSLRPMEDTFHKIYFYVSFSLLILRVTSVCVFGGGIYDEHEHITQILTTVPSVSYNMEVERFVIHMSTCDTALTGKHFFTVTRNLILKVTSTIVTYELVLIQFNQREFATDKTRIQEDSS